MPKIILKIEASNEKVDFSDSVKSILEYQELNSLVKEFPAGVSLKEIELAKRKVCDFQLNESY